jgi:hypothetical protein
MKGLLKMKKKENKYLKQIELANKGERKLRQDIHKPSIIPDKKKEFSKNICRKNG